MEKVRGIDDFELNKFELTTFDCIINALFFSKINKMCHTV